MKKLALLLISTLLCTNPARALQLPETHQVSQGSTLELRYPRENIESITGSYDGKAITFYPIEEEPRFDEVISRGEFVELLFQNANFTSSSTDKFSFPDVPDSHPFQENVEKAAQLEILHGYENGNFGPYDPITRGQIAKILVNAFDPELQPDTGTQQWTDIPDSHQFAGSITRAVNAGYFQGYPDGLMRPDRHINFSEAETVIKRATERESINTLGLRPYWRAFLGVHRLSEVGKKNLKLSFERDSQTESKTIPLHTLKRDFETVSFTLAKSKTELFAKDKQDNTWSKINAAKSNPHPKQLWEDDFIIPTSGVTTLGFGDKLYINGKYSGSHFGHDWANDEGTEIFASNHGIVTLADWTDSYGNTIIIDHGHNVFTMYIHLSELKVQEGITVSKEDLIGLMGSTGIATGSHLHFTHFIGDIIVDSDEWLE